mgnify:CR=1 FL=1
MKITDVKLRFAKHYLFVQVYTDAGIVGLGEAGNWGYLPPLKNLPPISLAKTRSALRITTRTSCVRSTSAVRSL